MIEEFTEIKSIPISTPIPKSPTILTISQSLNDITILERKHSKDHPIEAEEIVVETVEIKTRTIVSAK